MGNTGKMKVLLLFALFATAFSLWPALCIQLEEQCSIIDGAGSNIWKFEVFQAQQRNLRVKNSNSGAEGSVSLYYDNSEAGDMSSVGRLINSLEGTVVQSASGDLYLTIFNGSPIAIDVTQDQLRGRVAVGTQYTLTLYSNIFVSCAAEIVDCDAVEQVYYDSIVDYVTAPPPAPAPDADLKSLPNLK